MSVKKILLAVITSLIFYSAFAASGFYIGDGGEGKNILIYSSTMENAKASENYIAKVVKDSFKTNLTNYSKLNVLDVSTTESAKNVQKKSSDYIDAGKLYNSRTFITISTTKNSSGKFNITVTVINAETGKTESGYNSPNWYTQDEYIQKAGAEAAAGILPKLGVNLTKAGKQMLLNGTLEDNSSVTTKEDLAAINAELQKLEEQQKKAASSSEADYQRAEIQKQILMQQKLNTENALRQQEQENKRRQAEAAKNAKRDAKTKEQLMEMSNAVEEKAQSIRQQKTEGLSPLQKIAVIENEKAALLSSNESIEETIQLYNDAMDDECKAKIAERKAQPVRKAERDSKTGGLNETGKRLLAADIERIQTEYENMKKNNEKQVRDSTSETNSQLRSKITSDIKSMEGTTYTADSLVDKSVYFRVMDYDGDKEGWIFNITFDFAGTTILNSSGVLSYKEVTGEKIPDLNDTMGRFNYNNNVESYDNIFSNNPNFIEAVISYKIKADSSVSSAYTVTVSKIEFFKVTDSKKIKTVKPKEKFYYQYYPITDVDWKTGTRKFSDSTRSLVSTTSVNTATTARNTKNSAKTWLKSSDDLQTSYNTTSAYIIVPTQFDIILSDEKFGISYGYTLTKAWSNHLFYGANLKLGIIGDTETDTYGNSESDDDLTVTVDAIGGLNFNLTENLRAAVFAEAGIVTNGLGIGAGIRADYTFEANFSLGLSYSYIATTSYGPSNHWGIFLITKIDPVTYFTKPDFTHIESCN